MNTPNSQTLLMAFRQDGQQGLCDAIAAAVRTWMCSHGYEEEAKLATFRLWTEQEPSTKPSEWPFAAVMICDDYAVCEYLFTEGRDGFWDWAAELGLHFANRRVTEAGFQVPDDIAPELNKELFAMQQFDWTSQLVAADYAAIYDEMFAHFGRHPDHLHDLHWRGFEELCASIFQEQGYQTILGRGGNDRGVDIRLVQNGVHGPQLTVVQVKRLKEKISIDRVQQIIGAARTEGETTKGMLVTSGRFLPSARKLASARPDLVEVADGAEVAAWCKALGQRPNWLAEQAARWSVSPENVLVNETFSPPFSYDWCAVVQETPRAARLVPLRVIKHQSAADPMLGTEMPDIRSPLRAEESFTARRHGDAYVSDEDYGHTYKRWNGLALPFYMG